MIVIYSAVGSPLLQKVIRIRLQRFELTSSQTNTQRQKHP